MKRIAATLSAVLAASGPALATGSISCEAPDGSAAVELTLGSVPFVAVVAAGITAGETAMGTAPDSPVPIIVGQAFGDGMALAVDFSDPNAERIVASVRLVTAREGDTDASAGTLHLTGIGAWPVICVGP